jgi:hypothetical protein
MSLGRYLIGVGALLCVLGSLGLGAAAVRRSLLPDWRGAYARLAERSRSSGSPGRSTRIAANDPHLRLGEAFARAFCHDDVALALIAPERLREGRPRLIRLASEREGVGKV